MKKRVIIISSFIIVLLSGLIILYNKIPHYNMEVDGVKLAVTLDGDEVNSFPKDSDYYVDITCSHVIGEYLYDETEQTFKLTFKNIESGAKCSLAFTSNPDTLIDIVEAAGYHETFSKNNSYVNNPQTILINSTNFTITQGDPYGFEDDTSTTGAMKNTNQSQDSTNSVITLVPKQAGGYNLCYTMSSEQNYDYGIIKVDTAEVFNTKGKNTSTYVCETLGNITTSNTLEITYKKDGSTSSGTDTFSFYLEKGTYTEQVDNYDAGFRYEGEDPNNYVWFNNELWRIIGSVPTKVDSGASTTTTNLVKIIRNESIGGLVWNKTTPRPDWNTSTLYTLLNTYYYGAQNATGNTYCYGYQSTAKGKCDYRDVGINPTSYYGTMVKEVYWNTGASDYTYYPNNIYVDEMSIQTMTGYVGIMNISDYGFASSYNRPTRTAMTSYHSANYTGNNWLYGEGYEWTITPYSAGTNNVIHVDNLGDAYNNYVYPGYSTRPVVYLDSSVYVVSGDGSQATPCKIAWPYGV